MQRAYDILGVPPNASPNDIKSAYRAAVKANHPDLSNDPVQATKALKEINAAFGVLRESAAERPSEARRAATDEPRDRRQRPTSVFGATRRRAEEEMKARTDAREADKQARDWKGDTSGVRTRIFRGTEDIEAAKKMANTGDTPAERRAAELRALREIRMNRNAEPGVSYDAEKETRIREEALDQVRRELAGGARVDTDPKAHLRMRSASAFGPRDSIETITTDAQDQALEGALHVEMRKAARDRVRAAHAHDAPPEIAGFHKAQKISFEGRTMKIHLGSPAVRGRNMIAIPDISQNGSEIKTGKSARLLSLDTHRNGGQALGILDAAAVVKGGKDMTLQFVFSDQPENLRGARPGMRAAAGSSR